MGAVKQLWMDKQEAICQDYHFGRINRSDAFDQLVALHVDPHDAMNMLDHAQPETQESKP